MYVWVHDMANNDPDIKGTKPWHERAQVRFESRRHLGDVQRQARRSWNPRLFCGV